MSQETKKTTQPGKSSVLDKDLASARLSVDFDPVELAVVPVSLRAFRPEHPCPVDLMLPLYDRESHRITMQVAEHEGSIFQVRWRNNLLKAGMDEVYVRESDLSRISNYFASNAGAMMEEESLPLKQKAAVLRETASLSLRRFFADDFERADAEPAAIAAKQAVAKMMDSPQVLSNLSEVIKTDYEVYGHSVNVCLIALSFGRFMELSNASMYALGMGALLHDVGMAKLPKDIADAPRELTPYEREQIRKHPRLGYNMLLHVSLVPYDALMIIQHHHENADGSGYPASLVAARTPYLARVVRICDAFEAITTSRPHRDAKTAYEAACEMADNSGRVFGADLVAKFIKFLASPACYNLGNSKE